METAHKFETQEQTYYAKWCNNTTTPTSKQHQSWKPENLYRRFSRERPQTIVYARGPKLLSISLQLCLDVKGDHFQHWLWAGPVLHRSRYEYINLQVIISITSFFIDNSLEPLARESPSITAIYTQQLIGSVMINNVKYSAFEKFLCT
jgi:hypothetical protein